MTETPSRLRALLDAATPLPWGGGGSMRVNMPLSGEVWCSIVWGQKTPTMEFDIAYMPKDFERTPANLSLIVAAVNALPSLLAQAERVAELEREVLVLRRDLAAAHLEIAYEFCGPKAVAEAQSALEAANAALGGGR